MTEWSCLTGSDHKLVTLVFGLHQLLRKIPGSLATKYDTDVHQLVANCVRLFCSDHRVYSGFLEPFNCTELPAVSLNDAVKVVKLQYLGFGLLAGRKRSFKDANWAQGNCDEHY